MVTMLDKLKAQELRGIRCLFYRNRLIISAKQQPDSLNWLYSSRIAKPLRGGGMQSATDEDG